MHSVNIYAIGSYAVTGRDSHAVHKKKHILQCIFYYFHHEEACDYINVNSVQSICHTFKVKKQLSWHT